MAKFCGKSLKLGTNEAVYFGDSDQAKLWFDGAEFNASHTISGVAATAGYHLVRKDQMDDAIATVTGTIITDHGALTGRDDDDHTQYILVNGNRAFTGTVGGITPTADAHLTTKAYVDSLINGLDWQDSVISNDYNDPATISGTPSLGDRYIIGPTASGTWAGNSNNIAEYNGSGWDIESANEGFASWVEDEDILYVYNGSAWVKFGATVTHANLIGLDQDDHTQYILATGARNFSGKVSYDSHPTFTTDEELVDKKYVDDSISTISGGIVQDHGNLVGLDDDDHLQYVPTNADRGFTATVSGIDPTQDYHLATKKYIDDNIITDHGSLTGKDDDDHLQYVPVSASRGFVATVSGIDPTQDYHLATKKYIDDEITANVITAHSGLSGLDQDDHTQYILATGLRAFSGTVSGVAPTADAHLTTKQYVDDAITTATGSLTTDHGSLVGLADDDHLQYVPTNADRGFTATVSGIDPTQDYHLTTKNYVDSVSVDKVKSGRTQLATNDSSKSITFGTAFADANYTVSVILSNTVDADPCIYPMIVSAKSNTGFSVILSGEIDSNNYYIEWICRHD